MGVATAAGDRGELDRLNLNRVLHVRFLVIWELPETSIFFGQVTASFQHDDFRANLGAVIEIFYVAVRHSYATGRNGGADRFRLVRTVDAVVARAEIKRARAQRVVDAAGHVFRQVRSAL
jgi:hypothetical protein